MYLDEVFGAGTRHGRGKETQAASGTYQLPEEGLAWTAGVANRMSGRGAL